MVLTGQVKNGVIVLDKPEPLPEGALVLIAVRPPVEAPVEGSQGRSLLERLASVVGKVKDLPPDASLNIDHYLYGLPKKS